LADRILIEHDLFGKPLLTLLERDSPGPDHAQNRVSQPDRPRCTICTLIRSCACLLPNSVVDSCAGGPS
jgi:hypothetical protein